MNGLSLGDNLTENLVKMKMMLIPLDEVSDDGDFSSAEAEETISTPTSDESPMDPENDTKED